MGSWNELILSHPPPHSTSSLKDEENWRWACVTVFTILKCQPRKFTLLMIIACKLLLLNGSEIALLYTGLAVSWIYGI